MIHQNKGNHIMKYHRLFHQFTDEMCVKFETERLTYIYLNQQKLCTEEYVHLRDVMNVDGNANSVRLFTIFPPCILEARGRYINTRKMRWTRALIQSTKLIHHFHSQPKMEQNHAVVTTQSIIQRSRLHYSTCIKAELKAILDFIVKYQTFGDVRCWMYSMD